MKHKKSKLLGFLSSSILIGTLSIFPSFAALQGHLDTVDGNTITGWAWDNENINKQINVELTISGKGLGPAGQTKITVPANVYRSDLQKALGSGSHSFSYNIDWSKFSGSEFTVTASAVSGNKTSPLIGIHNYKKSNNNKNNVNSSVNTSKDKTDVKYGPGFDNVSVDESNKTSEKNNLRPNETLGPGYAGNAGIEITYKRPDGSNRIRVNSSTSSKTNNSSSSNKNNTNSNTSTSTNKQYEEGEYLGKFTVSGYCNCFKCSGGHDKTYSGTAPKADHTLSADLSLFPIGTKLMINDIVYTVEDKGSGVKEKWLDIYFDTHEEAYDFGLQKLDVYYVKKK